ncbi:MAG: toxin-antitoxin system YwqK family antitoxin [Chloroflexota bacterium]|jgi:antitoxin component YwqK of YwqJK toxin-antitoxin module
MDDDATPIADIAYYPSGTVKSEGYRLHEVMHGEWVFYRLDGSVMRRGRLEGGRQVGSWRTFDRTGRLIKETDFGAGR